MPRISRFLYCSFKEELLFLLESLCFLLRLRRLNETHTVYRGISVFPEPVNSVIIVLKMPPQQHVDHHKIKYHI